MHIVPELGVAKRSRPTLDKLGEHGSKHVAHIPVVGRLWSGLLPDVLGVGAEPQLVEAVAAEGR